MGKLILCNGKLAEHPFRFKLTGTGIYSIEELCYFLYNNSYLLRQELFDEDLVDWLRDEIDMPEMADKLHSMITGNNSLTDIVISLLCSCDYYGEKEVGEMLELLETLDKLSDAGTRKMRADNLLEYGNYAKAAKIYEALLQAETESDAIQEKRSEVLHNLGVAYVHIASYRQASEWFRRAYEENEREDSLKQYLFALKLAQDNSAYEEALEHYEVSEESKKSYERELGKYLMETDETEDMKQVMNLKSLRKNGRINEYYSNMDKLIGKWKQEYRKEVG